MTRNLRSPHCRLLVAGVLALPLLLSACGGDGAPLAYIPPPPHPRPTPTPTPTPAPAVTVVADAYPVSRLGTYDLLGVLRQLPLGPGPLDVRATLPGEFTMAVFRPAPDQGFTYKLEGPPGFLPGSATLVDFGPSIHASTASNGSIIVNYGQTLPYSADQNLSISLTLDVGNSYVSMGSWGWGLVHLDGGSAGGGFGQLLFVAGDRTPASGIPASGTATYDSRTMSGRVNAPFALTADFGQRTIATRIDQDYRQVPGDLLDDPVPAIHVSGSAPFSNSGSFEIPLSGMAGGFGYNVAVAPPLAAVTGTMSGAFFGPHAEQVGGIFSLQNSTGVTLLQDAFVGKQH